MSTIVRWSPPPSLLSRSPFRALDEMMNLASPSSLLFGEEAKSLLAWPQLDLVEEGNELILKADLPGLSPEELSVEAEKGILTISGERTTQSRSEEKGYLRTERRSGSFMRRIPLPEGVESKAIQARYEQGVLEVRIPKPTEVIQSSTRIPIISAEAQQMEAPALETQETSETSSEEK